MIIGVRISNRKYYHVHETCLRAGRAGHADGASVDSRLRGNDTTFISKISLTPVIRKRNRPFGFTLIEILLVASLFSICSLAIYNVFSSGIKLWAHAQRFAVEEDISIFFDKLSEDLRNSFYYSKIKFDGTQTKLSAAAFITTPADPRSLRAQEGIIDQIGAVSYYFDFEEHVIYRAQANYAQALDGRFPDRRVLVKAVDGIRFVYYMAEDGGVKPYASAREVIPSSIYVEVKYHDEHSERTMARFIPIPTGI